VLLRIGAERIQSSRQFGQLLDRAPKSKPIPVLVRRGENTLYLALEPAARKG
jgi:hypothetical protein